MTLSRWAATHTRFDAAAERAGASRLSLDEEALLRPTLWDLGEEGRLREDLRFRPTPWGRWMASASYLANEALFTRLHREPAVLEVEEVLADLDGTIGRRCVLCAGDPRLVVEGGRVRLSARELGHLPLVEPDVGPLERYVTHLPVHSLRAAAASVPAGEWGRRVQEEMIETLGWVRVSCGRRLNPKMFVARLEGRSMDDGRSGLVDGGHAIFELWPPGPFQQASVLVRGAFSDPDTGAYAVKRYVAEPGPDGAPRRVRLVSLNPDKQRYPDLELDVQREDEPVTVVATVVQPLALDQYARRPRARQRPGRRDRTSPEGLAAIAADLAGHVERFFERLPAAPGDERGPEAAELRAGWGAGLVCLEAEAGGLYVEVGPLVGLWSFVKQLRVVGGGTAATTLASNLRQRPVRLEVAPGDGPWRWEAVGFEDEPDLELSRLAVPGLPADQVAVFRVDAAGVGRPVGSRVLAAGQRYRLLVPDGCLEGRGRPPALAAAGAGWSLWELDLAAPGADELAVLAELGLDLGEGAARLEWALVAPAAWRTSPRGEPYACFVAGDEPVLEIGGAPVEDDGAASLHLHGPGGDEVLPLAAGARHLVRLVGLEPGRHVARVLHDRTAVAADTVAFEVLARAPAPPAARCEARVADVVVAPRAGTTSRLPASDLARLDGAEAWTIKLPPGWPVRLEWRDVATETLAMLHAGADGEVDATAVTRPTYERRRRRRVGDLVLDLGELGAVVLPHERRATVEEVRRRVDELLASAGGFVERARGDYLQLVERWFVPVCRELGYELEATPVAADPPPGHMVALPLLVTERRGHDIARAVVRVLVLVEDLIPTDPPPEPLMAWIDGACLAAGVRHALVSDGLRWAEHRYQRRRTGGRVWDLRAGGEAGADLMELVDAVAEGV